MPIGLDGCRVESALEEMAGHSMAAVERLRVDAVQPLEAIGERRFDQFDYEVVVVRHQAVRVESPLAPLAGGIEQGDQASSIGVVAEDFLASVSSRGDVENVARALDPELACHVPTTPSGLPRGPADTVLARSSEPFQPRPGVRPPGVAVMGARNLSLHSPDSS